MRRSFLLRIIVELTYDCKYDCCVFSLFVDVDETIEQCFSAVSIEDFLSVLFTTLVFYFSSSSSSSFFHDEKEKSFSQACPAESSGNNTFELPLSLIGKKSRRYLWQGSDYSPSLPAMHVNVSEKRRRRTSRTSRAILCIHQQIIPLRD